jgi:hypothetical protein
MGMFRYATKNTDVYCLQYNHVIDNALQNNLFI